MDEPTAALAEHEVELLYRPGRAGCGSAASPSSTSPTGCARSSTSPTASPSSRTARWSRPRATAEITPDELVRLMVGRDLGAYFPPRAHRADRRGTAQRPRRRQRRARRHRPRAARRRDRRHRRACRGPGRTELARALFGAEPFTRGRDDPAAARARSGEAVAAGHRPGHRGPQGRGARAAPVGARQRPAGRAGPRYGARPAGPTSGDLLERGTAPAAAPRAGGPVPVRRQPAEGRAGQVAGVAPAGAALRRADPGHRRRRQGRHPRPDARAGRGRHGRS